MKIGLVHNAYGRFSGEEAVVRDQAVVLERHGHEVIYFERKSEELGAGAVGYIKGFFSGIYNPFSRRQFRDWLRASRPDILHIHNLFPLISVSILPEAKKAGIPVVMTVHNFRLVCPNGLFYSNNAVCERCVDGKEYWCVIRNCEQNIGKSLGYALRTTFARIGRYHKRYIDAYLCLSNFQYAKLVAAGFDRSRMQVLPNPVKHITSIETAGGDYVAYVGRMSHEKGIAILCQAARSCPDVPIKLAGQSDLSLGNIIDSSNIERLGYLEGDELEQFFSDSRLIVVPSVCYEGFPTVILQAMIYGKPVVASRIGGLPEIVDDGVTGLLVEANNPKELAEKIRYLWERPDQCKAMGEAGRRKVVSTYGADSYYDGLMNIYRKCLSKCG